MPVFSKTVIFKALCLLLALYQTNFKQNQKFSFNIGPLFLVILERDCAQLSSLTAKGHWTDFRKENFGSILQVK